MVRGPVAVQNAPAFSSSELDNVSHPSRAPSEPLSPVFTLQALYKLQTIGGSSGGYELPPNKDSGGLYTDHHHHRGEKPGAGSISSSSSSSKYEELFYNPAFSSLSVEQLMPVDSISVINAPVDKQTDAVPKSCDEFDIGSLLELVSATNKEGDGGSSSSDFVIPEPPLQFTTDDQLLYGWEVSPSEDPFITGFYSAEEDVKPPLLPAAAAAVESTLDLDFMLPPPAKKPTSPLDPALLSEWFPELTPAPTDFWPLVPSPLPPPPESMSPATPPPPDSPQWSHDSPMSTSADAAKPEATVAAELVDATFEKGGGAKSSSAVLFGQQEDDIIHKLLVVRAPGAGQKPVTRDKLVSMPVEEFNQLLEVAHLAEIEVAFMKEWRRRGKNKAAAQVARKRKREELTDLDGDVEELRQQREGLQRRYDQLRSHIATLKENAMAAEDSIYSRYSLKQGQAVSRETHTIHVTDDESLVLVPKIRSQVVMF